MAVRIAAREHGDVYHFHDPELIIPCFVLALLGHSVVYDVHEDVPRQMLIKQYLPTWLRWLLAHAVAGIEAVAARVFAGFVVPTPTIAARFPKSRTILVRNFPRLAEIGSPPAVARPGPRESRALYLGAIGGYRGLWEMMRAASDVHCSHGLKLVFVGAFGSPREETDARAAPEWSHVEYRGYLDREGVAIALSEATMGLFVAHPTESMVWAYPTKVFEYMAAGLPVIASDWPILREFLNGEDGPCGLLVDPLNSDMIRDAILWILEHPQEAREMGARGARRVREHYVWEREAETLAALYERIAPARAVETRPNSCERD